MWRCYLVFGLMLLVSACSGLHGGRQRSVQERLDVFPTKDLPVHDQVTIYWDQHQIPFFFAEDHRDVPLVLGLLHSHLRLGQMAVLREVARGRVAKLFGPFATDIAHTLEILDADKAVPQMAAALPESTRVWIRRYVEGINFYQRQLRQLPGDFAWYGLEPRDWTVEDVLALSRLVGTDVNWLFWFGLLSLREESDFDQLYQRITALGRSSPTSFDTPLSFLEQFSKSGSNAFAVAGKRSASGAALMASDPHVGLNLPSLWCLVGYQSPEQHVLGMTVPGLPVVLLGRNRKIAWGATNMLSVSSTLYQLTPAQVEASERRKVEIPVRWWFDREVLVRDSAYGPVISDAPLFPAQPGEHLALRWRGHEVSDELTTFLKIAEAQNFEDFRLAFQTYAVSGQNYLYADRQGNIGQVLAHAYQPVASLAAQVGFPTPANDAAWSCSDERTPDEMPSVVNPEQGYLISANNRPTNVEPPITWLAHSSDRIDQAQHLFNEVLPEKLAWQDLKRLQLDTHSAGSLRLARALVDSLQDPQLKQGKLLRSIAAWDGDYLEESHGALAFQLLLAEVIEVAPLSQGLKDYYRRSPLVMQLVLADFEEGRLSGEMLRGAVLEAQARYSDGDAWGDIHKLRLQGWLGAVPVLGRLFRYGDYGASGSTTTLLKTAHSVSAEEHYARYGANARHISDLSSLNENYFALLGGQDGAPSSQNHVDLAAPFLKGQYLQIPMERLAVEAWAGYQLSLSPP